MKFFRKTRARLRSKLTSIVRGAIPESAGGGVQHFKVENDELLFLQGQACSLMVREKPSIKTLRDVEFRVFSQFGEDGILEWLVHWLDLPENTFVEFGVENYREANTRFLVANRNWRGLVMDGSEAHMEHLKSETFYWRQDVVAHSAFVTAENINELLEKFQLSGRIGLLSVDIDGNDFWVLKAIRDLRAALLVVEVNPIWGDIHPVTVPYQPDFDRFDLHYSGLAFGMSIAAARSLAEERGYLFLGTCSNGINAFFVRADLATKLDHRISEKTAWPALHRDSRGEDGKLSFVRGVKRTEMLKEVEVWHCNEEKLVAFGSLKNPFSSTWLKQMETT